MMLLVLDHISLLLKNQLLMILQLLSMLQSNILDKVVYRFRHLICQSLVH